MRTCAYYADRSKYDYQMMISHIYIGNQCYLAVYHDINQVMVYKINDVDILQCSWKPPRQLLCNRYKTN